MAFDAPWPNSIAALYGYRGYRSLMIRRSAMNTGTKVCKPLDTEVEQKKRWPQQDLHCSRWGVKTDVTVFCDVINKTHDLASL